MHKVEHNTFIACLHNRNLFYNRDVCYLDTQPTYPTAITQQDDFFCILLSHSSSQGLNYATVDVMNTIPRA
jgi:hypothetical protein